MSGKSSHSKVPPEGLMCKASWEDITKEAGNYVEYKTEPSGTWHSAHFSAETVRHLLNTQFTKYLSDVENAAKDCAAAVRRVIAKGPPMYLEDREALPLPDGDTHISTVWFAKEDEEVEARLVGSLEGDAREALWSSQKETLKAMEEAEATSAVN